MPNPVSLDVAFVPGEMPPLEGTVAVVLDVIRASTTIVTLLDRGCQSIGLAESVESARVVARTGSGVLLCGEVGGLPPYGFDHGNSPSEFAQLDLTGRHMVMATTNGTAAIRACAGAAMVLVGAAINANAVIREALQFLRQFDRLLIVCAGRDGRFVLDDAAAAGYLCHIFLNEAKVRSLPVAESNSAIAAYRLYHSYPNLLAAFNDSDSAKALYPVRLERDVSYCAKTSISKRVPQLAAEAPEHWHDRAGVYLA